MDKKKIILKRIIIKRIIKKIFLSKILFKQDLNKINRKFNSKNIIKNQIIFKPIKIVIIISKNWLRQKV